MTRDEALEELLNYENEYGFNPSDVYAVVSKIYDELEALQARIKELEEPKTCETCVKNKGCKIMAFMFRDRLNKEGYAMHRNEMLCLHFYEQKSNND